MSSIRTIGKSGQISLGKKYAGETVLIEELEPGVWLVKTGRFIPHSEAWLHQPQVAEDLEEAVRWSETNEPSETDLDGMEDRINK